MRFRLTLVAVFGLAVMAVAQYGAGPLDIVRWSPFKSGATSLAKAPFARAIVSEADFQTYWAKNHGNAPQNAPRGIDWLKEQLVAIHLGERNSGGYEVKVTSMKRSHAAEITIEYAEVTPAKGTMNAQMMTSPWVVVRMDRAAGSLNFKKTTRAAMAPISGGRGCGCCARCSHSGPAVEILNPIAIDFPNPYGNPHDRRVWWRAFDQGETCAIPGFGVTTMRNVSDLGRYWMRLTGQNRTPWDREPIDWMREQLVAINLGKTAGPGYRMVVDSVERTRMNEITVRYTVVMPPPGPPIADRVSSPYAIIRMERNSDNLVFIRQNVQPYGNDQCDCRCGRCRGC